MSAEPKNLKKLGLHFISLLFHFSSDFYCILQKYVSTMNLILKILFFCYCSRETSVFFKSLKLQSLKEIILVESSESSELTHPT